MFNELEVNTIIKGLDYSQSKNNEIKQMLMGMSDPEVEEIDSVISSTKTKLTISSFDFSQRELSEIKTGLMGLLTQNINDSDITEVLGKIHELIED